MLQLTIQDLMDRLPDFFVPERAAGIKASVQFDLTGEQGGQWLVNIENAACRVSKAKNDSADLIFQAASQDVLDIFYNRLNPMSAFMQGKLRLKGNFNLALKLFNLFDLDQGKLDQLKQNS